MKISRLFFFLLLFRLCLAEDPYSPYALRSRNLFSELAVVEQVNLKINDHLPFIYNYVLIGGYFNMPSARMNRSGTIAFGGRRVHPYSIYGVNFQMFRHVELSGNYRVYTGITAPCFGHYGYGDDADRIGNVKIGVNLPGDGFSFLPSLAFGAEDFFGTGRFSSEYLVFTKQDLARNFEITFGWGRGRIKGPFGGLAWTPFRHSQIKPLKPLSLVAEYDAINYKEHKDEHPEGREVDSRINVGFSYNIHDMFQVSASSVRGREIAASLSYHYPLGSTKGFVPKIDEPSLYSSPRDFQPLGVHRPELEFGQELAYALLEQDLDLYTVYLLYNQEGEKVLWIKVINNRYWRASEVKKRLEHVLAAITPSNIVAVTTVIEAEGLPALQYHFRTIDLYRFENRLIGETELNVLSPMQPPSQAPSDTERLLLFHRRKSIWALTLRPRLLTFFGSSTGKFKYSLSAIASPEGYLFDQLYYKFLVSYNVLSSNSDMGDKDILNPSQLINVRSDTVRYFQRNTLALEQGYLQRSWSLTHGWYSRLALGYFEAAYGGVSGELLFYPVDSNWALGIETAVVRKRDYEGLGFMKDVRKLDGCCETFVPFLGLQYFLDLYYDYRPLQMEFKIQMGQFLARDKGARFEVGRYFDSGLRLALWLTLTDGKDCVNGSTYHDKGFMFSVPLDLFMRKSSRTFIGYSMAAWLRDVGAISASGKGLYNTLYEERRF